MKQRITRREFLNSSARLTVAGSLSGIAGCDNGGSVERAVLTPRGAAATAQHPPFRFSEAQRAALFAAVARLIPAAGPDDWSAADAGAVEYVEQLLNGFSAAGHPRIYAQGPTRERFAEFRSLSRAKAAGWQREVLRLRELYVEGLNELNRLARGPLSLLPGDFAALPPLAQDALLTSIDLQGSPFFAALFAHTMEAVYSHPVYGGNSGYLGWNSLCYAGDVHGVRFPNGHDPRADDRPWDKFGGYAPEEMIKPGSCTGGTRSGR